MADILAVWRNVQYKNILIVYKQKREIMNSEDVVSDSIDFLLSRPSHGDHGSRSSSRAGPTTRREGGAYLCGFLHTELHVQLVEGGRWRRGREGGGLSLYIGEFSVLCRIEKNCAFPNQDSPPCESSLFQTFGGNGTLLFVMVQREDAGSYFCNASNDYGSLVSQYLTLRVSGESLSPPPITYSPSYLSLSPQLFPWHPLNWG